MCDYCGCRDSGPTAELAAEHATLQDLTGQLNEALAAGADAEAHRVFAELAHLLDVHAAKEEVGLFPQARLLGNIDDRIDDLIHDHDVLHGQLGAGPRGPDVQRALKLLSQHIDDEEWDLFPHVFHALDPEQWDEVALAHLAVEEAFAEPSPG
jgi:hemerythrin-like domain-containing protein